MWKPNIVKIFFQVFRKPRSAGYSTGPGLGSREDLTFWWGPNKVSGILETVDQKY